MTSSTIYLDVDGAELQGTLAVPAGARGLVIFVDGRGDCRMSRANREVAGILREAGYGTLLLDLLTPDEEQLDWRGHELPFDIASLASRLSRAIDSVRVAPPTENLRIGLFGVDTGTAAALTVAARRPAEIAAVVSHSGRPDLACENLRLVRVPTLLIVGVNDSVGLGRNRFGAAELADASLQIVDGGSFALEKPEALHKVGQLASSWFEVNMARVDAVDRRRSFTA